MNRLLLKVLLGVVFNGLLLSSFSYGADFNLNDYKGKVVYLDFWASWCGPCRQSFPFMNTLKEQYEEQGLAVVSVNVDEEADNAAKFLAKNPAIFDIIYDSEGKLAQKYQLKAMPTSFLFDREGQLVGSHLGFKNKDIPKLNEIISTLLSKK